MKPLAHVNRKSSKMIEREARVAPCAPKHSERARIPNRTAGWQFLLDGERADVPAAKEHINNERQEDKYQCIKAVCTLQGVTPDLLVHDGMCPFKAWAQKRHKQFYGGIKHWCVDEFRRPNHKFDCPCRRVAPAAKKKASRQDQHVMRGAVQLLHQTLQLIPEQPAPKLSSPGDEGNHLPLEQPQREHQRRCIAPKAPQCSSTGGDPGRPSRRSPLAALFSANAARPKGPP
eukprot:2583374-Pyramimonas_sp.AAC.1